MKPKTLKAKGEVDYDYQHDIILFKIKNRDYVKSIELNNLVLDIDKEGFITGIQIFKASNFFNLTKNALLKIPQWQYLATVDSGRIEIRLAFKVTVRNKIIEKNPIIVQETNEPLPNSEIMCDVR